MLVVVPYAWRCTVTIARVESSHLRRRRRLPRSVVPGSSVGDLQRRTPAIAVTRAYACVCVYVCICVDCCSNWDNVSPLTIVAEEGEQPAHLPAHRVMTQRWRSYGRYCDVIGSLFSVKCGIRTAVRGSRLRWALLKCRLLATFKLVSGLRGIWFGNSCWQMCFANTLFLAPFSLFITRVFVDRFSERGPQSRTQLAPWLASWSFWCAKS